MRISMIVVTASLGALAGCAGFFKPVDKLRPRVAFDLKCPDTDLQFTELGGDCGDKLADDYTCTIGVTGCGQQATYVHVPRGDWVLNAARQPGAAPAPAAPPK